MQESEKRKSKLKIILLLHAFLMVSSILGISSKLAAQEEFFSLRFFAYYAIVILNLGVYAIVWQQLIKRMPLTTAYVNKAIGIVWGVIWGCLFFNDEINIKKIIAIVIIIIGVILVVTDEEEKYD